MTPQHEENSRKAELIRVAARLFREQGYERTTVRDLGQAVGLQSGSLFYHFRSKEAILVAVMAQGISSTTEQLSAALAQPIPLISASLPYFKCICTRFWAKTKRPLK